MPAKLFYLTMTRLVILFLCALMPSVVRAQDALTAHLSTFGPGAGPAHVDGVYRLLDRIHTPGQSNAVALDVAEEGAYEQVTLRCNLRVLEGGDGV
jgi:hypothetical protein